MGKDKEHYICNYASCRKAFKRKHDWSRHLDTHLGVNYHCDKCGKSFSRLNSLNLHTKQCSIKSQPYASMDGQLLDVTPVLPVNVNVAKTPANASGFPQKAPQGLWVQTDNSKSVNKAIKLLSKYHNFEPIAPTPGDSHKNPRAPQVNQNPSNATPTQKLMDLSGTTETGQNQACKRVLTLPTAHASDKSAINQISSEEPSTKQVSFQQGHTLIPPAPPKRTQGFKRKGTHDQKLMSAEHHQPADNVTPRCIPHPGHAKERRPEDCPSTSTTKGTVERKHAPLPKLIPLDMSMEEEPPTKSVRKGTNEMDPRGHTPKLLNMPDGMPEFITEPDGEERIWKDLFSTPDRIVSPIRTPPLTNSQLPTVNGPPTAQPQLGDSTQAQDNNTLANDCIGYISPSSGDDSPNKGDSIPDICVTTNGIIVDLIAELSLINDVAMHKNLEAHQKPLKKILSKLRKVTKKLD